MLCLVRHQDIYILGAILKTLSFSITFKTIKNLYEPCKKHEARDVSLNKRRKDFNIYNCLSGPPREFRGPGAKEVGEAPC